MGLFDWGSSSSTQTGTTKQEPWGPQQGFLKNIMSQAEALYQQPGPSYYSGQTTVPFAPETQQALAMQASRAQQGSPLNQAAKGYTLDTLNGGNANPYMQGLQQTASGGGMNPYLDSMYSAASRPMVDQFQKATAPGIAGRFLKAGRWGDNNAMRTTMGGAADILGQNLAGLSANIYGQGFESERNRQTGAQSQLAGLGENFLGRQQQAAQFAPTLANQDYADIGQLQAVGRAREDLGERQIGENMNRWNYEQQLPANKLGQFLQFVQGNYGGTQQTQQPVYKNQAAGGLGGAMAGAQLGSMFGSPWLGAIGGGLLGAFG